MIVLQSSFETVQHDYIFKNRPILASFIIYFRSFSNKNHYNFYRKYMGKNVHPVYVAGIWNHNLRNMSLLPWPLDQGPCPSIIISMKWLICSVTRFWNKKYPNFFPKVAQQMTFLKTSQKVAKYLGNFSKKICFNDQSWHQVFIKVQYDKIVTLKIWS